jgi:DNA-binding NtrC family response regulator
MVGVLGGFHMLSLLHARLRVPLDDLKLAADTDVNLVITTGSSADALRIATTVHRRSRRSQQPLVTLRFGATTLKSGWDLAWAAACTGTLLIVDTERAPLRAQEWLSARFRGACTCDARRVRVFAGAEGTLHARVQRGEFSESVYYQLNVLHLRATPWSAAWLPRLTAHEQQVLGR